MAQNLSIESTLTQQFITMTQGSASATAMNLPNSLIEPFNLASSTSFYSNYSSVINAFNDAVMSLKAESTGYIEGYINPAYLRLSCHFNGSGTIPNSLIAADSPLYNSNTSAAKLNFTSSTLMTPPAILSGGTPSASTASVNNPVTNAFDGSTGTYWSSVVPQNIIPTDIGSATSRDNTSTAYLAFDGNTSTVWDTLDLTQATRALAPVTTCAAGGTPSNVFTSSGYTYSENNYLYITYAAPVLIAAWSIQFVGPKNVTISASNDNSNWTTIYSNGWFNNLTLTLQDLNAGVAYRYYRWISTDYWSSHSMARNLVHYISLAGDNSWLRYDAGSNRDFVGTSYSINSSGSYALKSWVVQGSNDDLNWSSLDTVSDYTGTFPYVASFSNSTSYRYWRLLVSKSILALNYRATASEFKVYTNETITPFITEATPQYVVYDIGSGISRTVTRYIVNASVYTPKDWKYQGSNDNTNWVDLDSVVDYASTFPVTRTFSNITPYRYFRLLVTESSGNSDIVRITELSSDVLPVVNTYNTSIKKFGTSSADLTYYYMTGIANQSVNHLQLGTLNWRFSGFFRFKNGFAFPQTLFTLMGKQLEILATATGITVNYSTNGTSFTSLTSSFSWNYDEFYWIAIGRTANTLTITVNSDTIGTHDLTGVTFFATVTNAFSLGADSSGLNPFIGMVDEVELFIGDNPPHVVPTEERSTAFIPSISWQSASTYFPAASTEVSVVLFKDETQFASLGVPEFGTDAFFYISLDNGTTFHEMNIQRAGSLTVNTSIYRGTILTTGMQNTNQFKYKIVSNSGKVFKFDGICIYWQDESGTVTLTAQQVWDYAGNELTSIPSPTSSMKDKLAGLFQYFFNKRDITTTQMKLYKDDGTTVIGTSSVSDNGTTVTKGKVQ